MKIAKQLMGADAEAHIKHHIEFRESYKRRGILGVRGVKNTTLRTNWAEFIESHVENQGACMGLT